METNPRILIVTIMVSLLCLSYHVTVAWASLAATSPCNGSAETECADAGGREMEEEVLMESWASQRFMAERGRRISYGALKGDQPACGGGGRGNSYSGSCLPPPSNPYSRGCSKYYRCRSDS